MRCDVTRTNQSINQLPVRTVLNCTNYKLISNCGGGGGYDIAWQRHWPGHWPGHWPRRRRRWRWRIKSNRIESIWNRIESRWNDTNVYSTVQYSKCLALEHKRLNAWLHGNKCKPHHTAPAHFMLCYVMSCLGAGRQIDWRGTTVEEEKFAVHVT